MVAASAWIILHAQDHSVLSEAESLLPRQECALRRKLLSLLCMPMADTGSAGYISNHEIRDLIAQGNVRQYEDGGDVVVIDTLVLIRVTQLTAR